MKHPTRALACALLSLFLPAVDGRAALDPHGSPGPGNPRRTLRHEYRGREARGYREGELLVRFKGGVSEASRAELNRTLGSSTLREFRALRLQHVRLGKGMRVAQALERYRSDPSVEYAEPNYLVRIQATPGDPRFAELWNFHNTGQSGGTIDADIDGPEAWDLTTGSGQVVVAVIDTGIDFTHPDLLANLWVNPGEIAGNGLDDDGNGYTDDVHGINTITDDGVPWDDHGHGTHVSGIVGAAADNGVGVVGVSWHVRVMSCKFLDAEGSGAVSDAIECLQYVKEMKDRGAAIVATNNSWGGEGDSQALDDAIRAQEEILFIAAAGNDGTNNDVVGFYPASAICPNLVAVAATQRTDSLAGFSNFGSGTVHVGAPGESILSTLPAANDWFLTGGYGSISGTSMAAPHVSGLAALLKSQDMSRDWKTIRNLVLSGGDPVAGLEHKVITGRRINAHHSVSCSNRSLVAVVRAPAFVEIGVPVTLSALSVTCGAPTGPVTVTASGGESLELLDDGVAPDATVADGIFTARWTPVRDPEMLVFSSPAGSATITVPEIYISHYLAEASTNAAYQQRLTAVGTKAPATWTLVAGGLPPGLALDGATGQIAGNVTTTGTFSFTVRVTDAWGRSQTRAMSLRVDNGEIGEVLARTLHEGSGADGRAIAVDASGNIHLVGGVDGKSYVAKYDPSGMLLWLERREHGYLRALAVDESGNVFAAGGTQEWESGDTLLVKLDPSGNELWERAYDNGQQTDVATDVALDGGGNIFLGGIGENALVSSMYAQKLDPSGGSLWVRTFSRGFADYGEAIGVDGAGNAYLGGSSAQEVLLPNGATEGRYDYFVRKYDPIGNLIWSRSYDTGSRYDFLSDLAVEGSGDVCVLGDPDEPAYSAFLTMKFSGAGDLLWVRDHATSGPLPAALAVDPQGNVYASGSSWNQAGRRDWDYLTLKYDAAGNLLWRKVTDGGYFSTNFDGDFVHGMDVDDEGKIYVTGASQNGVGGSDMLMLEYAAFESGGPSEAQHLTADRGPGANEVTVRYAPGCRALDHVIVRGSSPMTGGVSWTSMTCGRGTSGVTTFDTGPVFAGTFAYFVVVAQDASKESSYGRDSRAQERGEGTGLGACDLSRRLVGCGGGIPNSGASRDSP